MKYVEDILSLLQKSDLVISEAGYNTVNEIISAKTPAIFLPGHRNNDNQEQRAKSLEEQGAAIICNYDADSVCSNILDLMRDRKKLKKMADSFPEIVSGNEKAAFEIHRAIENRSYRLKVGKSCNNNCVYCDVLDIKGEKDKSLDELKDEIKALRKYKELIFPCNSDIRKDIIALLKYAKDLGFRVVIESNGRMFSYPGFYESIRKYVDKVCIFLNSADEDAHNTITRTRGTFRQTVRGIKNTRCQVNTVITDHNYENLSDIFRLVKSLGVRDVWPIYPVLKPQANRKL